MSEDPQKPSPPRPAPPPKKERPAAPTRASPGDASLDAPPPPAMHIVDDDDAVLIPELAPERLIERSRYGVPKAGTRSPERTLFFRRTMIPILLTCGLMLPALAGLWLLTDPDHVVRGTGVWLPITFLILGAVFLLLAVVNMAQVRHLMKAPMTKPQ